MRHVEEHRRRVATSQARAWQALASAGGDPSRYPPELLWRARGLLDRAVGGPGFELHAPEGGPAPGARLDFWEVTEVAPPAWLRLRARMRLPGTALLDLEARPTGTTAQPEVELVVRTTFEAAGPLGDAYWWASLPAHRVAFALLASRLAALCAAPDDTRDAAAPGPTG